MKIKDVIATCLYSWNIDENASDSSQDDVVVEIVTDEGITGIGESDGPPSVIKAFIDMPSSHDTSVSLKKILIGEDPLQIEKLWNNMYQRTLMAGRRGAGINAIGAIDMALWDLAGKYYDKPIWKLLGGAQKEKLFHTAACLPSKIKLIPEVPEFKRRIAEAKRVGFRAVKLEELMNNRKRDYDLVSNARESLG